MAPRGNNECPNDEMGPRWHKTGSPACAVLEEKLGSSIVQCKSVPAGTISSRVETARAPRVEMHKTRVRSRDFPAMVVSLPKRLSRRAQTRRLRPGDAETPGMVGDWSKRKRFCEGRQPRSDFNGITECLKCEGN